MDLKNKNQTEKEKTPFGDEWIKAMMKKPKIELVDLLRIALIKISTDRKNK